MGRPPSVLDDDDDGFSLPSIYDPDEDRESLWLEPVYETASAAEQRARECDLTFAADEWLQAQAELSFELGAAAYIHGRYSDRISRLPLGMVSRLAMSEVSELSWWVGSRLPIEQVVLFAHERIGAGDEAQVYTRASWALRRLTGSMRPYMGDWYSGLSAFLNLNAGQTNELAATMSECLHLHKFTQGAVLFHGWRLSSADREAAPLEAAILAASCGSLGPTFSPLALGGGRGLRSSGSVLNRLRAYLLGIEQGALAALLQMDRIEEWHKVAQDFAASLSGKTPRLLIDALFSYPALSVAIAQDLTGASRASVQRNLERLTDAGIAREITGQSRYRFWCANAETVDRKNNKY